MSKKDIEKVDLSDELSIVSKRQSTLSDTTLTVFEQAVIYAYSNDEYAALNTFARSNPNELLPEFGQLLQESLLKLPPFEGGVYRCVTLQPEDIRRYEVASRTKETIIEPFFVSTSKSKVIAEGFGNTLFFIVCKSGREIAAFSKHQGEDEVLIPHGTTFRVTKIKVQHDGRVVIMLKET